ncbi:MAG: hypothetical protein DSY87_06870 [Methylococcus sp.]|nr:MAG: hypothetical protein DSY87_06870 [Methylococcus sp.]
MKKSRTSLRFTMNDEKLLGQQARYPIRFYGLGDRILRQPCRPDQCRRLYWSGFLIFKRNFQRNEPQATKPATMAKNQQRL